MQFRSAHYNARYVMKPEDLVRDQYGRVIQNVSGLAAEFRGMSRIFDSEVSQANHGWTDEQRIAIERYLMAHPSFNIMHVYDQGGTEDRQMGNVALPTIGLAPGQLMPKEHLEFAKSLPWYQAKQAQKESGEGPVSRCAAVVTTPDGEIGCPRFAEVGEEYCLSHLPQPAEVS